MPLQLCKKSFKLQTWLLETGMWNDQLIRSHFLPWVWCMHKIINGVVDYRFWNCWKILSLSVDKLINVSSCDEILTQVSKRLNKIDHLEAC